MRLLFERDFLYSGVLLQRVYTQAVLGQRQVMQFFEIDGGGFDENELNDLECQFLAPNI